MAKLENEELLENSSVSLFEPTCCYGRRIVTNVDIVFCIDATAGMYPIHEEIKRNAFLFHGQLRETLIEKHRTVNQIRLKVIFFRDVYVDSDAFIESKFFVLPDEEDAYAAFVNNAVARGGGDEPESGLEALAKAIASDWVNEGQRRRHIIIIFTDAPAHPLDKPERDSCVQYPSGMPKDLIELEALWRGSMDHAKRLAIFAPNAYPWNGISYEWDLAVHSPSRAGEGCSEAQMQLVIECIVNMT